MAHLVFANDNLLFCRANQQDCNTNLDILHLYETTLASGQQTNRDKNQLFFSSNTDQAMKDHIKASLGVSAKNHIESYLGIPSFVGRGKKKTEFQLYQREGLAQDTRLEGEITFRMG